MQKQMNREMLMEVVNCRMLGQNRKEEEFAFITKELISHYYDLISCENKKTFQEATFNWINKNIMTLEKKEDFIPWVLQIATVCALVTTKEGFLNTNALDEFRKGISYPYLSIEHDVESFIPTNADAVYLTKQLFQIEDQDLKKLIGFFFLCGLTITEIAEYSEGKVTNIAAGVQCLKTKLVEIITKEQKSPEGEYHSLAEDNIILRGYEEDFYRTYNEKFVKEETLEEPDKEATKSQKLKNEMKEALKAVNTTDVEEQAPIAVEEIKAVEESPQLEQAPVIVEQSPKEEPEVQKMAEVQKITEVQKAPVPEAPAPIKKKEEKEKNKLDDAKFYMLVGMGIALAGALFIGFVVKIVTVVHNSKKENTIEVAENLDKIDEINSEDLNVDTNEQITRLTEAYQNQVGTVSIVLSGTTNEAPKNITSDDFYYFFGNNYEFDLQYQFSGESEDSSITEGAEIALEYTDRTEHLSPENYENRKERAEYEDIELYTFDDEKHLITTFSDWTEGSNHTAYDYEKMDCITTWLSVLDSNRSAIEALGDGCDLLPVMAENLTTTVNGRTYELVFYKATGYFIKDDDTNENEGHSTNYTIVCDAYLETF